MDKKDIIRLKIPSNPKYVSSVRVLVEDLARKNGFDKAKIEDLKLANFSNHSSLQ